MSAPLLHRLLTPEECDAFSEFLAEKYERNMSAKHLGTGHNPLPVGTAHAGSALPREPAFSNPSERRAFQARETLPAPPLITPYSREMEDPWDMASEELDAGRFQALCGAVGWHK